MTSEEARELALKLWRNSDLARHSKGSCAGCHGPDFVDLAVIGSTEADIVRRAEIDGASPREAEALAIAVADMRERHAIPARDARSFRPFQPGGAVLLAEAVSPAHELEVERDIAFGRQLEALLPTLFGAPIDTLEEAEAARAEMLDLLQGGNTRGHNPRGLDLRSLPTGITYPLWSADLHHGGEEGTFNDWIADIAHDAPADDDPEWQAVQDAYLADPSRENFWRMYKAAEDLTEAQLLADCTYDGQGAQLACGGAEDFNRNKFQTALIGSHMLREQLDAHASTFAEGPLAFSYVEEDPRLDFMMDRRNTVLLPANPWEVGDRARVMLSNDNEEGSFRRLLGELGFPDFAQESIDSARTAKREQQELRLAWFWIGFTMDPSFARIHASNSTKVGEYMIASLLEENMHLHNSFAVHARIVAKGSLPEANVEGVNRQRRPDRVEPVFRLNYNYFLGYGRNLIAWRESSKAGTVLPDALKSEQETLWTRFNTNAFRMGLHLWLADHGRGLDVGDVRVPLLREHFKAYAPGRAADAELLDRVEARL